MISLRTAIGTPSPPVYHARSNKFLTSAVTWRRLLIVSVGSAQGVTHCHGNAYYNPHGDTTSVKPKLQQSWSDGTICHPISMTCTMYATKRKGVEPTMGESRYHQIPHYSWPVITLVNRRVGVETEIHITTLQVKQNGYYNKVHCHSSAYDNSLSPDNFRSILIFVRPITVWPDKLSGQILLHYCECASKLTWSIVTIVPPVSSCYM